MSTTTSHSATGRRKTSTARVWISEGSGQITINGRSFEDYFPTLPQQNAVLQPFQEVKMANKFNVTVRAAGGGIQGQVGAVQLGIARALTEFDASLRSSLKVAGLLSRDPRAKERKKAGQPGARKNFQFSKR